MAYNLPDPQTDTSIAVTISVLGHYEYLTIISHDGPRKKQPSSIFNQFNILTILSKGLIRQGISI